MHEPKETILTDAHFYDSLAFILALNILDERKRAKKSNGKMYNNEIALNYENRPQEKMKQKTRTTTTTKNAQNLHRNGKFCISLMNQLCLRSRVRLLCTTLLCNTRYFVVWASALMHIQESPLQTNKCKEGEREKRWEKNHRNLISNPNLLRVDRMRLKTVGSLKM